MPDTTREAGTSERPDDGARQHDRRDVETITRKNVEATRRLDAAASARRSHTDRAADVITRFCGSMAFVWLHAAIFTGWIVINCIESIAFDPYPFTFLTLVVSLEAIFLSSFILISQNYDTRVAAQRSQLDLQINLLAEQENTKMLRLLERIAQHVGAAQEDDPEIRALEQATNPDALAKQIEDAYGQRE